jgi:electron transfer flavoprotein beta subunit
MNVVVLVKYIPNPQGTPQMGPEFRLKRHGVEGGLDPGDEHGVEAGLKLAEAAGEVTVVSMGPEPAIAAIRTALSMGAHKAVQITDDALEGADALATARVLARAIEGLEYDLVIGGVESTDGSTGTVPQTIAGFLGLPSMTFARNVEVRDGVVTIERQTETGYDVIEAPLPALVTVTAGANEPRYPTLRGIMQAKQKPLDKLSLSDLGLSADEARATQEVIGVEPAAERGAGELVEDLTEAPARILEFLQRAKVI